MVFTSSIWSDKYMEPLTEEYLHILFPTPNYRLSIRKYPYQTKFSGRMRQGTCFVLSGAVKFHFERMTLLINEGWFSDLPGGDYEMEVNSAIDAKFVLVWDLEKLLDSRSYSP